MNKYFFAIISLCILLNSCTTFREVHYFKDKIQEEKSASPVSIVPNYYKVSIKGWAFMSSSRYLSGYFDQNSVNEYFNEIPQPEKGNLYSLDNKVEVEKSKGDSASNNETKKDKQAKVENNFESGSELVLILSTNSEAIATQIKNTAVNKDVLKSLTLLANKDELKESKVINKNLSQVNTDISSFISNADFFFETLNPNDSAELNNKRIFDFLRNELKEKGITKDFENLEKLKEWYYENY